MHDRVEDCRGNTKPKETDLSISPSVVFTWKKRYHLQTEFEIRFAYTHTHTHIHSPHEQRNQIAFRNYSRIGQNARTFRMMWSRTFYVFESNE